MSSVCSSSNLDSLINDESIFSLDAASLDAVNLDDVQSTPEMCLIMNQHYQAQLEDFIYLIQDKLEENRQKQQNLKDKRRSKFAGSKDSSYMKFMTPYFRDKKGLRPPSNEDTEQKHLNKELNQNYAFSIKRWTPSLEATLFNSIKEFYLKDQLGQLKIEANNLQSDLNSTRDKHTMKSLRDKIDQCNQRIEQIKNANQINLENDLVDKIDWLYISKLMDNTYDDLNCKLYWTNYLHPKINKEQWSIDETSKLGTLTNNLTYFNWERIAEQLGTNRKAWQVAKQYQITFNSNIKHNGSFTDEEIEHLANIIKQCQIGDYIPWNQVVYFTDGRSKFQLKQFWEKHLSKQNSQDQWSLLEDAVLYVAFKKYNLNWKKISVYLPGRSNRQCRERFVNRLAIKNRRLGNWTKEEDTKLLNLVKEKGHNFKEISKSMKGRNDSQIRNRYRVIIKNIEAGDKLSYKKNKLLEMETIKLCYMFERLRRIRNPDTFLSNSRNQLIHGLDPVEQRKNDIDHFLKSKYAIRRAVKKSEEDDIDNEIVKMFDHYNLIPKKYQEKPNAISAPNMCFNKVLQDYLNTLMDGKEPNQDFLMNNVMRYLIKNQVTDYSNQENNDFDMLDDQSYLNRQHPPILPPNRTTMLGFFGVLMHEENLKKFVEDNSDQLKDLNFEELKNDEEYKRLNEIFCSLFLFPAILTDSPIPVEQQEPNSDEELNDTYEALEASKEANRKSKKRKNSVITKQERQTKAQITTKIRIKQMELVDSYTNYRKEN